MFFFHLSNIQYLYCSIMMRRVYLISMLFILVFFFTWSLKHEESFIHKKHDKSVFQKLSEILLLKDLFFHDQIK